MALKADDARDRAEQLVLVTTRLTALIQEETKRIEARLPPLAGADAEEKTRLANAYRLELTRIKHDTSLIDGAGNTLLSKLRQSTETLNAALAQHEIALGAVKLVSEGLVQAMAAEVSRVRRGETNYGASGGLSQPSGPSPTLLDKSA